MKSIGSLCIRGVGAAVTLAAIAFCSLNAHAEVVFGNLGTTTPAPIDTTSTELGLQKPDAINWVALGFNTNASSQLLLDSVTVGLFGSSVGTVPLTVSIFSSKDSLPDSSIFTSSPTAVGGAAAYSFTFTEAALQPNTEYFVVPNGGNWHWKAGTPSAPQGLNGSGYSYTRTVQSQAQTSSPTGDWADAASGDRYSVSVSSNSNVSITAVPEPSTVGLAGIGIAGAAVMVRRRKPQAVALVTRRFRG
jgi:hypothetical protein